MLWQRYLLWVGVVACVGTLRTLASVVVAAMVLSGVGFLQEASAQIVAAVLPSSRSVQVGTPATAFATLINTGQVTVNGCRLALPPTLPAAFTFQTTNPATNQVTGTPNTPVDIPAGAAQSFVFAIIPSAVLTATDVAVSFSCTNSNPAPSTPGLNTLLLSAATTPIPDIIALAAVATNDGRVKLTSTTGTGAFAVATVNVGTGAMITPAINTGGATLPLSITLCQTDPLTGNCLAPPGPPVTTRIDANATPTFGIFVTGRGPVPFVPGFNRIFVRFASADGVVRGSTSVAIETPPQDIVTSLSCSKSQQSDIWLNNRLGCLMQGQRFIDISSRATGRKGDTAYIMSQQAFDASFNNLLAANQSRYFKYFLCVRNVPDGVQRLSLASDLAVAIGTSNFSASKPPSVAASSLGIAGGNQPGFVNIACDPSWHPVIVNYDTGLVESVNPNALSYLEIYDL